MSAQTTKRAIATKRLCRQCQDRPALYQRHGRVKRRDDHDLCFQCFRAALNQVAAIDLRIKEVIDMGLRDIRNHPERFIKRHPAKVGDLIQYRFSLGLNTRKVIEVIDEGAKFIIEGGFSVNATHILAHIPMFADPADRELRDAVVASACVPAEEEIRRRNDEPLRLHNSGGYCWCGKGRKG